MTVEIKLTQGFVAIVDDEDADLADQFMWRAVTSSPYKYGVTLVKQGKSHKSAMMHRMIMERMLGRALIKGEVVDHINHNGRDNRRCNLRLANQSLNTANMRSTSRNTSGYKGVSWSRRSQKWFANIKFQGRSMYLGMYETKEAAARVYNTKALELFGEFAYINPLEDLAGDAVHTAETGSD